MQAHHIRGAQELRKEHEAHPEGVLLVLAEAHDVVVHHGHVEGLGPPRHPLADAAEPHDAQRLALELEEARLGEVAHPPLPRHHVLMLPDEPLVDGQDEHERVLGHGHRVGAPVVGDGHPRLPRGLDVEAVVPRADELHQLEARRRAVEVPAERLAGEAQVEIRVVERRQELRRVLLRHVELVARRDHGAGDVHDGGRQRGREHDLDGHGILLRERAQERGAMSM